ncbi:beta-1,4-galactosyltransferase 4 [Phyllopteryx taeniolatus]|uniref:beta-1,4-galactosyltransferase 4 n=1 Tax=Phyllopteryx taeniolatus TaxID=161469 RepID=UPI002AD33DC4|nr:beta-1,4-galactosyltransferase 4 [Phyllopteryx taeniolatus]XP_061608108.1 beta-1,4-galactosyltransferase 4 [Phyllopteryx taeniolatus]XP_061608109.1 beta-1,4-galactosyltransferase 4 [Phyllopteryx taeniolatus]XP_061608110.1 beta-1,4-galactosyltransferase 4 [Phyllopteryx taeniolatus]XP_061608111.1 beta-1,4-galactosyltransferase 4 [Phyllopteryx taeniolatus]
MGICSSASKMLRRVKYIFLLLLSLSVLAWFSMFSGGSVKSTLLPSAATQPLIKVEGTQVMANLGTSAAVRLITSTALEECPKKSPLLQGAVKLNFEPSLKLKEVEGENKRVTEGQYQPSSCTARQSVAILIPHRNRERHLLYLLHHLHPFLQRQQLHYAVYVVQQAGDATFNRAKLLNVGYLEALKEYSWDCFIFHDVDLVPENDHNLYICDSQPKHLVVGRNATGYKLHYKGYFGGVTAMSREQFRKVNGFANTYWGWGGEDDDLRIRVELQKMKIVRPPADIARYTMVFHKRDHGNEVNKDRMKLLRRTALVWKKDGLNSCKYQTLSVERLPLYVNVTVDIGKPKS